MEDKLKLIQEYLDGNLDKKSSTLLMEEINSDNELKREFEKMVQLNDFLNVSIKPLETKSDFSDKVMSGILSTGKRIINWKGLLLFLGIAISLIVSSFYISESNSFDTPTITNEVNIPYLNKNIPSITLDINWELIFNGLLFIGFFTAMLLLDISVLRPLLKKNTY